MMVSFNFYIDMQLQNSLFTYYKYSLTAMNYAYHNPHTLNTVYNANSVSVHQAYLHIAI